MTTADELAKLASLRERGYLTDAEFTRAKFQLLNEDVPPSRTATAPKDMRHIAHELGRSIHDRVFGGVCGGLAKQTKLPSWLWRSMFCICLLSFGVGLIPYVILWVCMPSEDVLTEETEYTHI
jgi:phage shock protein PspC (stress-responsive transcriptional regulator)